MPETLSRIPRNTRKFDLLLIAREHMLTTVRRHLLRLWLRNEELAWKTPKVLQPQWQRLYHSARPEEQHFPLEPVIRDGARGGTKY